MLRRVKCWTFVGMEGEAYPVARKETAIAAMVVAWNIILKLEVVDWEV